MKSFNRGIVMMVALVIAALGFMGCHSNSTKLVSIKVTPVDPVKVSGIKFTATGTFSDGMVLNYTSEVIWSSSSPTVATVGTTVGTAGYVTVLSEGTTTITAREPYNNFISSSVLTVPSPSTITITITPENPVMQKRTSHPFDAIATYLSSGITYTQSLMSSPTLTWSLSNPSDPSLATTVSRGLVTAGTITGSVDITATDVFFSSVSGTTSVYSTTTLTVTFGKLTKITVEPSSSDILKSGPTTTQLTAKGEYDDATTLDLTTSVEWYSSNTGTAIVSNVTGSKGVVTAVEVGTVEIKATDPISHFTGTASVTVQ